jgi:hypothetical protein
MTDKEVKESDLAEPFILPSNKPANQVLFFYIILLTFKTAWPV